jgi:hypothetical protein
LLNLQSNDRTFIRVCFSAVSSAFGAVLASRIAGSDKWHVTGDEAAIVRGSRRLDPIGWHHWKRGHYGAVVMVRL